MRGQRHRIPTHLNIEDKAILGLTLREVACVGLGVLSGFAAYDRLAAAPPPLRLLAGLLGLAGGAGGAFIRPLGRGLEEWCFVVLHYLATPRHALWHPRPPDPAGWATRGDEWARAPVRLGGGRRAGADTIAAPARAGERGA